VSDIPRLPRGRRLIAAASPMDRKHAAPGAPHPIPAEMAGGHHTGRAGPAFAAATHYGSPDNRPRRWSDREASPALMRALPARFARGATPRGEARREVAPLEQPEAGRAAAARAGSTGGRTRQGQGQSNGQRQRGAASQTLSTGGNAAAPSSPISRRRTPDAERAANHRARNSRARRERPKRS
jgi:hypothetical protein